MTAAFPKGMFLRSFQYFVHWDKSPVVIDDYIWLTKLVHFENFDELSSCKETDVLQTFIDQGYMLEFQETLAFCKKNNHNLSCILLPELPQTMINDKTPVWVIYDKGNDDLGIREVRIANLKEQIKIRSGGPIHVGSKGLTYGTSAVECYLSKTDAVYPGDVDCILSTSDGIVRGLIEYKKHTISDPIENHTASHYYQSKDRRKYDRLASLHRYYETMYPNLCPLTILYFSTRSPVIRIQLIEVHNEIYVVKDSGDIDIRNRSTQDVGKKILAFMEIL